MEITLYQQAPKAGQVERANRTIKETLIQLQTETVQGWTGLLPAVLFETMSAHHLHLTSAKGRLWRCLVTLPQVSEDTAANDLR